MSSTEELQGTLPFEDTTIKWEKQGDRFVITYDHQDLYLEFLMEQYSDGDWEKDNLDVCYGGDDGFYDVFDLREDISDLVIEKLGL